MTETTQAQAAHKPVETPPWRVPARRCGATTGGAGGLGGSSSGSGGIAGHNSGGSGGLAGANTAGESAAGSGGLAGTGGGPSTHHFSIKFDYRFDTANFFTAEMVAPFRS